MAVTSGFFDAIDHDRTYNAEDFGSLFDGIIKDGILNSYGDHFAVTHDNGLDIIVGSGKGWFKNTWIKNDDNLTLTADANTSGTQRIDTVVIDIDKRDSVRANSIIIVKGTSSRPVLIDEAAHKQYPLYDLYIDPTGSDISSILDRRDESYAQYMLAEQLRPYWPVGSIYMSINNIEPSTLFGGVWEQISGRFLIGCGGQGGFNNGDTGGSWDHTITTNHLPSHTHYLSLSTYASSVTAQLFRHTDNENVSVMGWANQKAREDSNMENYLPASWNYPYGYQGVATAGAEPVVGPSPYVTAAVGIRTFDHYHGVEGYTQASGNGNPMNIKPPYLAVYMWKRIS